MKDTPEAGKSALFIHILKCAGTSIVTALKNVHEVRRIGPHCKACDLFLPGGKLDRKIFFVFSFVRNPWDRLVSTFFYIMRGGQAPIDQRRRDLYLKKYGGSFEKFVLDIANWIDIKENDSIYNDGYIPHFRPRYEYTHDENGNCLVDFIGKVEDNVSDFKKLCRNLSVNAARLPRKNKSFHRKYWKYYNSKTRAVVAEYYTRDVASFSYRFRDRKTGLDWFRLLKP